MKGGVMRSAAVDKAADGPAGTWGAVRAASYLGEEVVHDVRADVVMNLVEDAVVSV